MKKIEGAALKRAIIALICAVSIGSNLYGYFKSDPQEITVERSAAPVTIPEDISMPDIWTPENAETNGLIDLNSASSEELQTLKGIGPTKAQAIIDYRDRYGGFTCIEEITEVKGIGEKTFEKIKDQITIKQ